MDFPLAFVPGLALDHKLFSRSCHHTHDSKKQNCMNADFATCRSRGKLLASCMVWDRCQLCLYVMRIHPYVHTGRQAGWLAGTYTWLRASRPPIPPCPPNVKPPFGHPRALSLHADACGMGWFGLGLLSTAVPAIIPLSAWNSWGLSFGV